MNHSYSSIAQDGKQISRAVDARKEEQWDDGRQAIAGRQVLAGIAHEVHGQDGNR